MWQMAVGKGSMLSLLPFFSSTKRYKKLASFPGGTGAVQALALSVDGHHLAAGSEYGSLIWQWYVAYSPTRSTRNQVVGSSNTELMYRSYPCRLPWNNELCNMDENEAHPL